MNNRKTHGTVRDAGNSEQKKSVSFIKRYNIIPKAMCFIAAFVMWIYVMQTESPEYQDVVASVPVSIVSKLELEEAYDLSVYGETIPVVNVKLTGKKSTIDNLSAEDISAFVDVSTITEAGIHALKVQVKLPDGISEAVSEPSAISVYADETDTVSLNVTPELKYDYLPGSYEYGEIKLEYDSITIRGAKKKLQNIERAQVTVNLQDKTSSFVTKAPITLIDKNGEHMDMTYFSLSVDEMVVTVPIYVEKEIPVMTAFKHGFFDKPAIKEKVKVTVSPESITVKGDEANLTNTSGILDVIEIDEKLISESSYTWEVPVSINGNYFLADDVDSIKVTVELDPSLKTKQFTISNIETTGASEDLVYEVVDKTATVPLRGLENDLSKIKTTDLTLVVDLSGYDKNSLGRHKVPATLEIDSAVNDNVIELGTFSIEVRIGADDE